MRMPQQGYRVGHEKDLLKMPCDNAKKEILNHNSIITDHFSKDRFQGEGITEPKQRRLLTEG
jgi:hypothetical protein